jgi:GNAT superfamily N-acetyltransferase
MGESAVRMFQSIIEQGAQDTCKHHMADETGNNAEVHGQSGTHTIDNSIREKVVIRRFGKSDSVRELTLLVNRAYKELADAGIHNIGATQDDEVTRQRIKQGECWVAELEGRIVGTVVFVEASRASGSSWHNRPGVAEWHQFAVDPEFQRLGIGSMLLETAEGRAKETGALELAGTTSVRAKHLVAMYARKGFHTVAYIDWLSRIYGRVVLSKSLQKDGGVRSLWDRIGRKMILYSSYITFRIARRSDDTCRMWVRVLRKVRSWTKR